MLRSRALLHVYFSPLYSNSNFSCSFQGAGALVDGKDFYVSGGVNRGRKTSSTSVVSGGQCGQGPDLPHKMAGHCMVRRGIGLKRDQGQCSQIGAVLPLHMRHKIRAN